MNEFVPKLVDFFRGYPFSSFKKDLFAGITVGVIALPLAMAFAIASGVTPEKGLYTAIVAGFIISALGGSRVQIGGPTGAFVVVIYDIMQRTGYSGLCSSMLVGAVLLILFGILRIGSWMRHVPHPLVTGFTTGIALIIFSSQIKDFFGLQMGTPPSGFIQKWLAYFEAFPTVHGGSLIVGSATLASILIIRKFYPRVPWGIASIVLATGCCAMFDLPIDTIASRFGQIPTALLAPSLPTFLWSNEIVFDGIKIALLGGIESLLSAMIGDRMTQDSHRSNCELVAQGVANLGSLFFGGIPATGAIARTAANVKMGAQSPIAGMIHAITLLVILLYLAPLASQIPLAALAAVLFVVAWNMSEIDQFVLLLKESHFARALLLTTFVLTLLVDITVAIFCGLALAFLLRKLSASAATSESDK